MRTFNLLAISIFLFTIISCSENNVNYEAEYSTIQELQDLPGFGWFYADYNKYSPKETDVEFLSNENNFNPATDKFLVFVKPACTCEGKHRLSPELIKTINVAGFDDSMIEVYVTPNTKSKHPYKEIITISDIPEFYILRNSEPIARILYEKGENIALSYLADK